MTRSTKQLTRRSFSTWLATAGVVLTTSPLAPAQSLRDSSESNERWTAAENESWQWYERESFINGQWRLTGITTPVHRVTGVHVEPTTGYLDESLVPTEYRRVDLRRKQGQLALTRSEPPLGPNSYGEVSLERRAQDGRPASEWLRSMETEELREWLSKIEVSEADVQGMTFWTHLTRDHSFRPLLIQGLNEAEQAKLHAAAHFGY